MNNGAQDFTEEDKHRIMEDYEYNKEATVGRDIFCPVCGVRFKKKTYQQAFCTWQKSPGTKSCKDIFWNSVKKDRRANKSS